mmetsp:Transcript_35681/g.90204  ORF Transcript_35681/g.90204 Transcript_35681/m.90204 type:complete len:201 (+) Transcript_35681:1601-2203(+)
MPDRRLLDWLSKIILKRGHSSMCTRSRYSSRPGTYCLPTSLRCSWLMRIMSITLIRSQLSCSAAARSPSTTCTMGANSSLNTSSSPKKSITNVYSLLAVSTSSLCTFLKMISYGNFLPSYSAMCGMMASLPSWSSTAPRSPSSNTASVVGRAPASFLNSDSTLAAAPPAPLSPPPSVSACVASAACIFSMAPRYVRKCVA